MLRCRSGCVCPQVERVLLALVTIWGRTGGDYCGWYTCEWYLTSLQWIYNTNIRTKTICLTHPKRPLNSCCVVGDRNYFLTPYWTLLPPKTGGCIIKINILLHFCLRIIWPYSDHQSRSRRFCTPLMLHHSY